MLWVQIGSATTGFLAAVLWLLSAIGAAPQMTYDGIEQLKAFLDRAGRLNRLAPAFTAVSVFLSTLATMAQLLLRLAASAHGRTNASEGQ